MHHKGRGSVPNVQARQLVKEALDRALQAVGGLNTSITNLL